MSSLSASPHRWWQNWLRRRLPAASRQRLTHRSVFILPTPLGLGFLVLCGVLFVFGTNYQNNLILGLCFLLVSLFNTALLLAFRNLSGLTLSAGDGHSRHAGEPVPFAVTLSGKRPHFHLELRFQSGNGRYVPQVDHRARTVQVEHPPARRGPLRPGRLVISSAFPLGLCRAWSRLDLDQQALIWPERLSGSKQQRVPVADPGHQSDRHRSGIDDFHGLAPWQRGQSLARIAWKQVARGGEWQAKAFVTPEGLPAELTLNPSVPLETALSQLAHQIHELHRHQQPYGLLLDGERYGPDLSDAHRIRCLNALACYPGRP
ncbi:DUF58 domain-containing protein [Marinobacter hydrocarbonoclasticus]|nr:DUF58 domain-containing protein [Marinobacter nauticus]